MDGKITWTLAHHLVQATVWSCCHATRKSEGFQIAETGIKGTRKRLAACDQGPPSSATIAIVFLVVRCRLAFNESLDYLFHITNLDQHILGLQVCVYDAAVPMKVVQAQQDLLCDLLNEWHGDASVIPSLDQTQQVLP